MLRNRDSLIEMCQILAEQENLRVTVQEASKGALITGFGAFAGALLAGPIGLAIGGTAASITTYFTSRGKYKSVVDILKNDLTTEQQVKLAESVRRVLENVSGEDCITVLTLVLTSASLKEAVLKEIGVFLLKELNMSMIK